MIRRLWEHPNCPYSHLVNKARDAIFRYRGKGSSVDGLLYQRKRKRQYAILQLEEPVENHTEPFEEKPLLREVVSDPTQPRRVTEERACANILLDSLRDHLSTEENDMLTLRLLGVPWREAGDILGQRAGKMARLRRSIVETARVIWSSLVSDREGSIAINNADEVREAS